MSYGMSNGSDMVMPVAPMMGGYGGNGGNGGGFGWGGDGAWWLLVLFLFAANGNGFGWGNGNGNGGGSMPYIMNSTTNNDVQRGFDQQAVMNGVTNISTNLCNGFAGVNQALCNGFAGVNATVNQGFSAAEASENARQIANMQQAFATQTAITGGLTSLQSQLAQCCCDNRLATANLTSTVLAENCADRAAVSDGIRDILQNQTANTQALINTTNAAVQGVMDKICQLELDAKNDKIADLQSRLNQAQLAASQVAQNSTITDAIYNRLATCPVGTTPVYGSQPIFTCNNNTPNYGCGCGCGR